MAGTSARGGQATGKRGSGQATDGLPTSPAPNAPSVEPPSPAVVLPSLPTGGTSGETSPVSAPSPPSADAAAPSFFAGASGSASAKLGRRTSGAATGVSAESPVSGAAPGPVTSGPMAASPTRLPGSGALLRPQAAETSNTINTQVLAAPKIAHLLPCGAMVDKTSVQGRATTFRPRAT